LRIDEKQTQKKYKIILISHKIYLWRGRLAQSAEEQLVFDLIIF